MIFTLVRNELIKIMKRGKTWVVFGLFLIMVVGLNVASGFSEKDMKYYQSPQGRIENLTKSIEWEKSNIEMYQEEAKTNKEAYITEQIEASKASIKIMEEEVKVEKVKLANSTNPNQWKVDLAEEKQSLEEELKKNSSNVYAKLRLEEIKAIQEAGIKPIKSWEVTPFNNSINLFSAIGTVILVVGIAIFMSDIVSGESTPPTLKFLLVQPISRTKVLISKFIAVIITVVGMIGGLELGSFAIVGALRGFSSGKMPIMLGQKYIMKISQETGGWPQLTAVDGSAYISNMANYFLQSFGLQILFIIACCSFIFLISTIFKSSMITMAVAVIISVTTSIASMSVGKLREIAHLFFLNYGTTPSVVSGEIATLYNNPNFTTNLGVILMVATIIICPLIAAIIFKKKDILI